VKTREQVIAKYETDLGNMTEEQRDQPMFECACGEHILSPRSILEAMKDPNNQDGQEFLITAMELANGDNNG